MSLPIYCAPYACRMSEASCAARYARTQLAPRAGLRRHGFSLCADCIDGRERAQASGAMSAESPKAGVDFRGIRSKSLETYVPRRGLP